MNHTTHIVVTGLAYLASFATPLPPYPTAQDNWLGKRVVPRFRELTLRVNDEPIENDRQALRLFRVEQVDGQSLLLKSETDRISGWARATDVIGVDQAVDYYREQIRREPTQPFHFAMMGLLRGDRHEHDLAIQNYDAAIRLDPKNAASFAGRATAWHSKGDFGRAISDFDAALQLDPKDAAVYLGRGLTRTSRNQLTLAIADFSEAIWLDPLLTTAYDNRGQAWQSKGEYAKSIIDYNMALRLDPQRASLFRRRASCRLAETRYAQAIADYKEAIKIDPGDAAAHRQLADLLATCAQERLRDAKLALQSATKACELTNWKEAACLDTLAAACAAAGDFESAAKWQTKSNALSRSPTERKTGEARLKQYLDKTR